MKEDKVHLLRKSVIIITIILIFATLGLLLVTTQIKTIKFDYFGSVKDIKTLSTTVDSFLLQNKIYVNDNQTVIPERNTKITNGMEIKIYSENELAKLELQDVVSEYKPIIAKVEEVVETIPFNEEKKENPAINRGTNKTVQQGLEGQQSTKYLVKYSSNEEVYRAKITTSVITEAKNQVIEVGTKISSVVSRSRDISPVRSIETDGNFKQYSIKLSVDEQKFAYNLCKKYGLDYELFLAMMYKESGYNKNALGGGNSYGLCQIHVSNHSRLRSKLGISNFYDPYDNMEAGAYLLAQYFGSARKMCSDKTSIEVYALNSYNMGEGSYYNNCFSKGILNRSYSTSILNLRNKLITQGWL